MGVNCVQILEKTSFSLTCIYLSIGTKVSHRISEFINGYIQMYMKKDYYESRKDFLKLREAFLESRKAFLKSREGSSNANEHITGFLFDDLVMRDILSYLPPGYERPSHSNTGGKKHNKKSRKTRKSKTFKNIK